MGVLSISVKRVYPPGVGGCLRNLTEWDLGTRKFYGMKPYGLLHGDGNTFVRKYSDASELEKSLMRQFMEFDWTYEQP